MLKSMMHLKDITIKCVIKHQYSTQYLIKFDWFIPQDCNISDPIFIKLNFMKVEDIYKYTLDIK